MNLIEITKGYEPKQNEQTEQMKSLPDITDKWKQLAKEQAASLELVTEERDELQARNQKMNEFIQKFQERTHKLKMEKQKLFFENHEMQDEIRKLNDEIHHLTTELSGTQKLQIQVNKSSVQAVDEAYRKQKEAEKQLQSLKYQAEQNRKIAEKEVQKLKKRIKLQSEKINEIKFFCEIGYIVAFVLSACLVKMCFL